MTIQGIRIFDLNRRRQFIVVCFILLNVIFTLTNSPGSSAQTAKTRRATTKKKPVTVRSNLPKIVQLDDQSFRNTLVTRGKPLLVNFWATWCDPCREEFPELVKIATDYKDKIDFVTISMDDPEEADRGVPRFLRQMKAGAFSNYLLRAKDEDAAIRWVSDEWMGGLPFTIILVGDHQGAYTRQGKIRPELLRWHIDKILNSKTLPETAP